MVKRENEEKKENRGKETLETLYNISVVHLFYFLLMPFGEYSIYNISLQLIFSLLSDISITK